MCFLTNERYKTYQTGFSFGHLGHVTGVGLGGTVGGSRSKLSFPKFNQICCVSYLHEWHIQQHHFWVPSGLREGPKGQVSLNLNYKVNFKDFKPNFVCLLTNERYKTYQMRFSFGNLGHA